VGIEHIINAWRDEEYRENLDTELRENLPESPIGAIDLSEDELNEADGGTTSVPCITAVTVLLCLSIAAGGTCQEQTLGCCDPAPIQN
jgi:mersacidin/lichenicidin family type 2 lantibiotic